MIKQLPSSWIILLNLFSIPQSIFKLLFRILFIIQDQHFP
jgi:hypothetical protein